MSSLYMEMKTKRIVGEAKQTGREIELMFHAQSIMTVYIRAIDE